MQVEISPSIKKNETFWTWPKESRHRTRLLNGLYWRSLGKCFQCRLGCSALYNYSIYKLLKTEKHVQTRSLVGSCGATTRAFARLQSPGAILSRHRCPPMQFPSRNLSYRFASRNPFWLLCLPLFHSSHPAWTLELSCPRVLVESPLVSPCNTMLRTSLLSGGKGVLLLPVVRFRIVKVYS